MKLINALLVFDDCPHNAEWVESQFNEDEQWAFCTQCNTDITKLYSNRPEPDYWDHLEQLEQESVPF